MRAGEWSRSENLPEQNSDWCSRIPDFHLSLWKVPIFNILPYLCRYLVLSRGLRPHSTGNQLMCPCRAFDVEMMCDPGLNDPRLPL